jgi:hypothetical protein
MGCLFVVLWGVVQAQTAPEDNADTPQVRVDSFLHRAEEVQQTDRRGSLEKWRDALLDTHAKHMALCDVLKAYDAKTYGEEVETWARTEIQRHRMQMKKWASWSFEGVPFGMDMPEKERHLYPYRFYVTYWKKRVEAEGADRVWEEIRRTITAESF